MIKVLVVDDEALVRRGIVMETDWSALGCMVVGEASNGLEGIELVHKYNPELIICDIRMPKMDGLEMMKQLRQEGCKARVIYLTAYGEFEYAREALIIEAADYLLKPFEDGELEQAVERVMNIMHSNKEKFGAESEQVILSLSKGDKSKYVMEALYYIRDHVGDPDLCVGDIAEDLEISESHLSHVFKKETSNTINAYITRYRVREAMRLLSDCRVKVYTVAEQVGYRDITYFSTVFKKMTGVNPSEYQDRCSIRQKDNF